jgi:hypothetical protein
MSALSAISFIIIVNCINGASELRNQSKIVDAITSWWFAKAFFAERKPPDVVVLGNSQLKPVLGADAYVFNKQVDITGDQHSYSTEHDMKLLLHKDWRVLLGALPEAMVSDHLTVCRALFSGQYKPKFVVLALSPASFINSLIPDANSTEPFTFFSKYADASVEHDLKSTLKKVRLEKYRNIAVLNNYMKTFSPLTLVSPFARIAVGEKVIKSDDGYSYDDDIIEYQRRYKNPDNHRLASQLHCLDELFKYLKHRNIAVAVVELPLTNANHILLPASFWRFYTKQVADICINNGVNYWDTNAIWDDFPSTEFCDPAHLSLRGGLKFTRALVLATAHEFHFPMYAYYGNFGALVPGKEKIYFRKN